MVDAAPTRSPLAASPGGPAQGLPKRVGSLPTGLGKQELSVVTKLMLICKELHMQGDESASEAARGCRFTT